MVIILVVDVGLIVVRVAAEVVVVDKVAMVVVAMIVVVVDVVAVDIVAMDVVAIDVVAMDVEAMVVVFTWSSLLLIVTTVATDTIVANMSMTVRVRAHKIVINKP